MSIKRIPCINPRCGCTAAQDKFPDSDEIICGKCFRAMPASLRRRHRAFWKRDRQLQRLYRRKDMQGRLSQIVRMGNVNNAIGQQVWRAIRKFFAPTEKPLGLDAFLEEMNL